MPQVGLKLTEKDLGWGKLKDQVLKLSQGGAFCVVGVQGREASSAHVKSQLTVGTIANVHEFGKVIHHKSGRVTRIPARSFIRAAIDEYEDALQKRATLLGTGVVLLKFTAHQALELLGMYTVGVMQQRIANRIAPPNRPRTIAAKGSSVPLIDSGQLRGSITYKVEA